MPKKILTTILFYLPFFMTSVFAGFHGENRPFGHNLSHTDYFPKNSCSVGIQVVACGNSRWAAGTSPFLLGIYNMANIYFLTRIGR